MGKAVLAFSLEEPVFAKTKKDLIWIERSKGGFYDFIFKENRDVYELATASLTQMTLENMQSTFVPPEQGSLDEIRYNMPHLTALVFDRVLG